MRKKSFQYLVTTALLITMSIPNWASPLIYPTGVTYYNPQKTYNCFVLFSSPDGKTHLIDMNGNEVHQWPYIGFPPEILDPAITQGQKGHVILQLKNGPGPWNGIFNNQVIGEVDWQNHEVWQWGENAPGGAARQNHDWYRLSNGHTLVLVSLQSEVLGVKNIPDQGIYELDASGTIVWKWIASEHLSEFGFSEEGINYLQKALKQAGSLGVSNRFLTINNMHLVGENRWFNKGDTRFDPNNIIIDSREGNFVAIIDKKSGKIAWRLGPDFAGKELPANFRIYLTNVPRPVDQLSGQHDAHIIGPGLPGEGNLLVFDNQGSAGYPPATLGVNVGSRVLEIDPTTNQIVWQYTGTSSGGPVWSFFSSFISSARRLPNGNTLIDEGMNGRIFQITPEGEIVWEYVSPYFAEAVVGGGNPVFTNWVFRAQPVPYEWIPDGTPRSEKGVKKVDITTFRVPSN